MLYSISMAVCSILHGGCHIETLTVDPELGAIPYMAMKGVEIEMAKWSAEHPEYTIAKWALHPMSRVAKS